MKTSIEEIHLIHHSHTDLGFTDLPSATWDLHVNYLRQAVKFALEKRDYEDASRFRWTCEALLIVEKFLDSATATERRDFDTCVELGLIEVTAMPFNATAYTDGPAWDWYFKKSASLFKKYRPRVAMQNDVNGFSWGLLPRLIDAGVDTVWMGLNPHGGGAPFPVPSFWDWVGPDERSVLAALTFPYCDGYWWFHDYQWRRGQVPSSCDPWFHPPGLSDIFLSTEDAMEKSRQLVFGKLENQIPNYPWRCLPLQITNVFRHDNDPPLPQLSDFVAEWNRKELSPRLRLSTASQFIEAFRRETTNSPAKLEKHQGDWPDWWADGCVSTPTEMAAQQNGKRVLNDLPGLRRELGASDAAQDHEDAARRDSLLFDEHTWGAWDCIAQPYGWSALGQWAEKASLAYRGLDHARRAEVAVIRESPLYSNSSQMKRMIVLNPGDSPRSGWVDVPMEAIRFPANAVRDIASGEVYPFEQEVGPYWGVPPNPVPYDRPNNLWGCKPVMNRFFMGEVQPGQPRKFEFISGSFVAPPSNPMASWESTAGRLSAVDWNEVTPWIDSDCPWNFGEVLLEHACAFEARDAVDQRKQDVLARSLQLHRLKLQTFARTESIYAERYELAWQHPLVHRVEQRYDFILNRRRLELTTTIWQREQPDAYAVYVALPFQIAEAKLCYDSAGYETEWDRNKLPGSCGEYVAINQGALLRTSGGAFRIGTPDTPLVCPGDIRLRRSITPSGLFRPHLYSVVTNNFWCVNFSITKEAKIVTHHTVEWDPAARSLQGSDSRLVAFPAL